VLRAVATLLESETTVEAMAAITVLVEKRIESLLGQVKQAAEAAHATIMDSRQAVNMIFNMCEDVRDEVYKATESLKDEVQKAGEGVRDEVHKVVEELSVVVPTAAAMEMGTSYAHGGSGSRTTYTEALSRHLPLVHPNTLARTCIRERQVLVDKDPLVSTNHLDMLSKCKLIANANEAMVKMVDLSGQ